MERTVVTRSYEVLTSDPDVAGIFFDSEQEARECFERTPEFQERRLGG